jgi:hypothetical protein
MEVNYKNLKDVLKRYTFEYKLFLIYLAIALVLFWYLAINITTAVPRGYGDVFQSMFNLWWVPYSLFVLHTSPYFTNLLYYPVGANFVTQTMSPIAGLVTWPLQQISSAFAYNVLFFTAFALSGLFMYMLAYYITGNKYASFIAGLIFAFSPMHIAQAQGHLDWTLIEFVPLFILFLIKSMFESKKRYPVFAAISFILLTFVGDIEQGIMLFLFAIIAVILLLIIKRKEVNKKQAAINLGIMVAAIAILFSPFLIAMAPHLKSAFSVASQQSALYDNLQWSDNALSFFLPSYYNPFFHGISLSYANQLYSLTYQGVSFAMNVGERVSYIGYSVLILMVIGILYDYKSNKLKNSIFWIIIFAIYVLLALGPYVQIYNTVTGIPTLYSLYLHIPYLNIIREPGRFDMIVTIAIAIMAAMGFVKITENKDEKKKLLYTAIIGIIILIEYAGIAVPSASSQLYMNATIPSAYYAIGNTTGNSSVLMLPSLPQGGNLPAEFTGMETYYVTATKKPLIGGYTSRSNSSQALSVSLIPLSEQALTLQYSPTLEYASPVNENVTNETILFLALYNTSFVTVIRSAYNNTAQAILYNYLTSIFGQGAATNSTFIFSTKAAISKHAGKSIVAYPVGSTQWVSGAVACYYSTICSQPQYSSLSNMWIGSNYRSLVIYAPNTTNVTIGFNATTYNGNTDMYAYLNNNRAENITLGTRDKHYALNTTLEQGFDQLSFYQPNSTFQTQVQGLTFGISNITFTKK